MREISNECVFEQTSFSDSVLAFWNRYRAPLAAHVTSEDTLARTFDGTCLHTIRLVKKERRSFPKWLPARLAAVRETWILERTIVDAQGGLLFSVSRNLTHRAIADGIEWQSLACSGSKCVVLCSLCCRTPTDWLLPQYQLDIGFLHRFANGGTKRSGTFYSGTN